MRTATAWADACDNCPLLPNPGQPDCDNDGKGDACAISEGISTDCNANGIPDDCDVASGGGSADCDANGVPDECQPDCDHDGTPDVCELPPLGTSVDCNANGVPDECDIRDGSSPDANANGIPDECEDGACCDLLTGVCTEDVFASACSGTQQAWTEGAACVDVACEAVTGACCDHDPFGACTDGVTRAACACPTCDWLKLGSCSELDCVHAPIPTVGEWGLMVLTLLLLTGAKLAFRRSNPAHPGGA